MSETATTHELRIERLIPATPDEVFDAYTDAEKIAVWFGLLAEGDPGVIEITSDARVGGVDTQVWGPNPDWLYKETKHLLRGRSPASPGDDLGRLRARHARRDDDRDRGALRGGPGAVPSTTKVHHTGITDPKLARRFLPNVAWPGGFDRTAATSSSRAQEKRAWRTDSAPALLRAVA